MARQEFGEQVVWGGAAHLCPWAAPQAHPRPRAGLPGRQASPSSRPRQRPRPASPRLPALVTAQRLPLWRDALALPWETWPVIRVATWPR